MSKLERLGRFIRTSFERITSSENSSELSPMVRANLSILRVVDSSLTKEGAVSRNEYPKGSAFNLSQLNDGAVFRVHYTPADNKEISFWRYVVQIHEPDRQAGGLFYPTKVVVSDDNQLLLPKVHDKSSVEKVRGNLQTHELLERSDYIFPDLKWEDPLRTFPQEFFIDVYTGRQLFSVNVLQIQLVDTGHAIPIHTRSTVETQDFSLQAYQPIRA